MAVEQDTETPPRRLTSLLLLGLFTMPIVFTWFLLRPGYSAGLRASGFAWLAFNLVSAAAFILLGATPR